MSSVGMNQMNQYFNQYDVNRDGKLDKAEVASASLNLLGQDNQASQTAGELFATFLQGGQNGQGLFPDFGNDGGITKQDLSQLASASGDPNSIESSDFQTVFPNQTQGSAPPISIDGLQQVAQGNVSKYTFNPNNPQGFENATSSLLPPGQEQNMMQTLFSGMQQLMAMFTQMFGNNNSQQ